MRLFYVPLAATTITLHIQRGSASTSLETRVNRTTEIPHYIREYWMRQANEALVQLTGTNCPFAAFGTIIVNHTSSSKYGDVICTGANSNQQTGNPVNHGEVVAINNCVDVLTDHDGPYRLTPETALAAFNQFSLYTNAESCPMCASAIRWAGFKEYIYGTSIDNLIKTGWRQIRISSQEVFERAVGLDRRTAFLGDILTSETDALFQWQFNASAPCPQGCSRDNESGWCASDDSEL